MTYTSKIKIPKTRNRNRYRNVKHHTNRNLKRFTRKTGGAATQTQVNDLEPLFNYIENIKKRSHEDTDFNNELKHALDNKNVDKVKIVLLSPIPEKRYMDTYFELKDKYIKEYKKTPDVDSVLNMVKLGIVYRSASDTYKSSPPSFIFINYKNEEILQKLKEDISKRYQTELENVRSVKYDEDAINAEYTNARDIFIKEMIKYKKKPPGILYNSPNTELDQLQTPIDNLYEIMIKKNKKLDEDLKREIEALNKIKNDKTLKMNQIKLFIIYVNSDNMLDYVLQNINKAVSPKEFIQIIKDYINSNPIKIQLNNPNTIKYINELIDELSENVSTYIEKDITITRKFIDEKKIELSEYVNTHFNSGNTTLEQAIIGFNKKIMITIYELMYLKNTSTLDKFGKTINEYLPWSFGSSLQLFPTL